MLSGDWIPVSLPGRVARVAPHAAIVGLGGATEASIWSNYFVIDDVDPRWRSIPYGWPLSNQSFHVLDDALQPRPAWAIGHLYIGGIGLAQGYYKDPERTRKSLRHAPRLPANASTAPAISAAIRPMAVSNFWVAATRRSRSTVTASSWARSMRCSSGALACAAQRRW